MLQSLDNTCVSKCNISARLSSVSLPVFLSASLIVSLMMLITLIASSKAVAEPVSTTQIQGPPPALLKQVKEALNLSGVSDVLAQIKPSYTKELARLASVYQPDSEQQAQLDSALLSIDVADIESQLAGFIAVRLSAQSMEPILKPLNENIMERFRRFERIAASSQQREKMQDFIYWVENEEPIDKARSKLLRECLLASGSHRMAALLQSFASVDVAVAYDILEETGVAANDPEGIKLWRSELETQLRSHYAQSSDSYLAFSYQFIRDKQLQEYAALWQDRNLQWFLETALQGLKIILRERRKEFVKKLLTQ